MLLGLVLSLVLSSGSSVFTGAGTDVLNPYNVDCSSDTCVVLPANVFRKTTKVVASYNYLVVENDKLRDLDSLSTVQRGLDSSNLAKKDSIIELHKQNFELLKHKNDHDKLKWFGYGTATGAVLSTILLLILHGTIQ